MIIHHFFRWCFFWLSIIFFRFSKKNKTLTAPWQPLGDFRAKLTPEVLPAAKSHFIAEELQPRAAEVQNKHEKTRWKKTICSWKDMERTIFFATKPRAFLMNYDLLCYCTTTIFMYRVFAIYLVWRRASTRIRPQYLFATLPTDQSNRIPRFRITITLAIRSEFHFKFWGCRVWGYLRF